MNKPNNNIIPQNCKMTDNTSAGVGIQNLEPRPLLPQQQNLEPRLPEDWKVVRLGEIGNIITGNTPSKNKKEYWEKGEIEFIKPPDLQNQIITTFSEKISNSAVRKARIVNKGTILVSCIGIIGRVGLSQKSLAFNQQINAIVPNENIYNHFLFYAIQVQQKQIEKLASFTTVPIVSKAKFSTVKIPLPPLPEQQKIAAVLSAVQEAKEKTEAVIAATKALKKSMMKHLFTYGPVSPQEAENVPLKETEIGPVPEDWEVVRLGDTFEFSKKPRNLKIKNDDFVPFIPMEMISETNKSIKSWEEKRYSEISSGSFVFRKDIIIAKITPSFENGKQAILDNLPTDFGYATTEIWALHPAKNKKSITYYLHYYLKISSIRKMLAGKMEGSTGRQRLPKHVLENLPIPLPPLPTQQKIASILSAIDAKIEAEENKKKALEELFKSLLHNLMTAKIRVNQLEVTS
jgi:type I restriction enzyme S subunit